MQEIIAGKKSIKEWEGKEKRKEWVRWEEKKKGMGGKGRYGIESAKGTFKLIIRQLACTH